MRLLVVSIWLLVFFVLDCVPAKGMLISQILYDPLNTESGGEAVEIHNDEETDVDISNWYIKTEKVEKDAVIPNNTLLLSGQKYLIADIGWNKSKDNPSWRTANLEETITLNNEDSGVILKNFNGSVIDKVGWGSEEKLSKELFNEKPAKSVVKKGNALVRVRNTGSNLLDFTESTPQFFSDKDIIVNIKVSNSYVKLFIAEDDSPQPGVQVNPLPGKNKILTVKSENPQIPKISLENKEIKVEGQVGNWTAKIEVPYWQKPGNYTIITSQGNLDFELRQLSEFSLSTNKISIDASPGKVSSVKITLRNEGNVPVKIQIYAGNISNTNTTLTSEKVWHSQETSYEIGVSYSREITIPFYAPEDMQLGEYTGVIRMMKL